MQGAGRGEGQVGKHRGVAVVDQTTLHSFNVHNEKTYTGFDWGF